MEARLLDSSRSALHVIRCNGEELSQMVKKGDFVIVVLKVDINKKNFAEMIPMVPTRGLRKPLDII